MDLQIAPGSTTARTAAVVMLGQALNGARGGWCITEMGHGTSEVYW